nr:cupin domain-containing protein [Agrobacterium tumefaciens]
MPPPVERRPAGEEVISGEPVFRTWLQDESIGGKVRTGIWEATPGVTLAIKDDIYEYCLILEGLVEIAENGGETKRYRAGDSFVFKPGFRGTWRTIETVRKMFIVVQ